VETPKYVRDSLGGGHKKMINNEPCDAWDTSDMHAEWTSANFRMGSARLGIDQAEIPAYMLPVEIDYIVNLHLFLLCDLSAFDPANEIDSEIEIRAYALARLHRFLESGLISAEKLNILSRLILHGDLFPCEDEDILHLTDLSFDKM
jgi:hypothetical protein